MNALMTMNRPRIEIANPRIIQKVFIENAIFFIFGYGGIKCRMIKNIWENKYHSPFELLNRPCLLNPHFDKRALRFLNRLLLFLKCKLMIWVEIDVLDSMKKYIFLVK